MKKLQLLALVMVFMLCFSVVAMAAPVTGKTNQPAKAPKTVATAFSGPTTVVKGESVVLTATTQKQASAYKDEWKGAVKIKTELKKMTDGNQYYVSTATFNTANLEVGTHNVTYTITMTAGSSSTAFVGTFIKEITVVAPGTARVVDFTIAQSRFERQGATNNNNPTQDNHYQLVITKLNVTYSDNSTEEVTLTGDNIIKIGGFTLNQVNRMFDVTFRGLTKQFVMNGPTTVPQ